MLSIHLTHCLDTEQRQTWGLVALAQRVLVSRFLLQPDRTTQTFFGCGRRHDELNMAVRTDIQSVMDKWREGQSNKKTEKHVPLVERLGYIGEASRTQPLKTKTATQAGEVCVSLGTAVRKHAYTSSAALSSSTCCLSGSFSPAAGSLLNTAKPVIASSQWTEKVCTCALLGAWPQRAQT